jgi:uncharacterized membrane protein
VHDLAPFLGPFHPVWVHLPVGILILLGLLELVGLASRARSLAWLPALGERQRTLILVVAAATSVLAAFLGWLLAHGGGYDAALVGRHQTLGIAAAAATVLVLALHRVRWLYPPLLAATLVLLTLAAHAGGKLTHGSDYLTAHIPGRVARMLGIAPPPPKAPPPDLEHARAFADVVQPIFEERCISCHGAAKNSGGLRLDSWELMALGGKHGVVVKPGDGAGSALIRRVDLPVEEKEHMPPRGKPQLGDDDLTLLEWWVGTSAPREAIVGSMELPPSVAAILETRLGGGSLGAPPDRAATLALAAPIADRLGIIVRPMSPDGPWLDVNARLAGRAFGDAELAQLAPIAPAIEWLDVGNTSVTDVGLSALDPMRRLQRLHLDQLGVSDAGLAKLGHLRQLEYLNLRGTAVTDKGLPALRGLPRLRALYVWQTAVTPEAVKALGEALVDKRRLARWRQDEADLERRIQDDRFEGNTGESLRPPVGAPPSPDAPKPETPKS